MSERWYKAYVRMRESGCCRRGRLLYVGAMHCLIMEAEWRDGETLKRGQLSVTLSGLADDWGVSRGQCNDILSNLEKDGFISRRTERGRGGKTIITICNYESYQNQTFLKQSTNITQTNKKQLEHDAHDCKQENNDNQKESSQTLLKQSSNVPQTIHEHFQDARANIEFQNCRIITSPIGEDAANDFSPAAASAEKTVSEEAVKAGESDHQPEQQPLLFDGKPAIDEKPSETRSDGVSDTPAGDDTGKPQKAANSAIKRGSCKSSARPVPKFDYDTNEWLNITDYWIDLWHETFPALDVRAEILRMRLWLISHLQQKKKNFLVFINNWLTKEQDRGGRNNGWNTQYRPVAGAGRLDPGGRPEVIRGADYGTGANIYDFIGGGGDKESGNS